MTVMTGITRKTADDQGNEITKMTRVSGMTGMNRMTRMTTTATMTTLFFVQKYKNWIVCPADSWKASCGRQDKYMSNRTI